MYRLVDRLTVLLGAGKGGRHGHRVEPRRRVLPVWEAAFVGVSAERGRASSHGLGLLLPAITAGLAMGDRTAAKTAIVAGAAGLSAGLFIALVERGRMITGLTIGVVTAAAAVGGAIAAGAPSLWLLAVGLFLLGIGGTTSDLWHAAVRRRERDRGTPLGSVNGELDSWTVASAIIFALCIAGIEFLWSWRSALVAVTLLVAANGVIALFLWRDRPKAERRASDRRPLGPIMWKARRQLGVYVAVIGAFACYSWPLTLFITDLGLGRWASLSVATLGLVSLPARVIVRAFGRRADRDEYAAARSAFILSLVAPAVLIGAGLPVLSTAVALVLLAAGLLLATGTLVGGSTAVRTQVDHGDDQAVISVALRLAAQVGIFLAGLMVAPLNWVGACLAGAALSGVALFFGGRRPR